VKSGWMRCHASAFNEFKGLAREAMRKLLELTDGLVVALDSASGFRHGPTTILNAKDPGRDVPLQ
jgi:fructoselysine-6-P-deglycase FrlB-like protein